MNFTGKLNYTPEYIFTIFKQIFSGIFKRLALL